MKKSKLLLNAGIALALIIFYVLTPTNINPLYSEGAFSWLFVITLFTVVNFIGTIKKDVEVYQDRNGMPKINISKSAKKLKVVGGCVASLWVVYILASVISTPLFNSPAYRNQLGDPEVSMFSEDMQTLDLSQVPIVDRALAYSLADKKLGENPGMGSQVNLGEPVIQQVNGELVWVVPLQHSGFFKWLQNNDGSAGYIKVSATNLQDIEYVESKIKYQPNSYFFDDITRHLRVSKGQILQGLTDYSFEIDDEGNPYWIITTYKYNWIFSLPEATGVIILNAQNGNVENYDIDNVPTWVDRVQPESFIMEQINNQGEYVHGVFNFSNKDKFQSSDGEIIVYNEGNCYLFTGLTSVGADESAIGFVMVDMVTKESKIYQMSGATEYAAQNSAEGKVQQFGYYASFPIIINHNGVATYFMTLKDNAGLIKQYSFVSVSDITSVGVGETISEALKDYNKALNSSNSLAPQEGEQKEIKGNIVRIASESVSNNLTYKFIIDSAQDKIFIASSELSDELAITKEGDSVTISYYESESPIISAVEFDNNEFTQK